MASPTIIVNTTDCFELERAIAGVRWLERTVKVNEETARIERVLQQQYEMMTFKDGELEETRLEWRDVPTVAGDE